MNERAGFTPVSDDWLVVNLVPLQSRLYRFINSLVPVRVDAEDLFQKSILAAWQGRAEFNPAGELFAWLCGIARNHIRHHYRSMQRVRVVFDQQLVEQLADRLFEEDEMVQRRQSALTHCLEKLNAQQRELASQYYQSEGTIREFAVSRGLGVEALYKTLQRVRASLRRCIDASLATEASR